MKIMRKNIALLLVVLAFVSERCECQRSGGGVSFLRSITFSG